MRGAVAGVWLLPRLPAPHSKPSCCMGSWVLASHNGPGCRLGFPLPTGVLRPPGLPAPCSEPSCRGGSQLPSLSLAAVRAPGFLLQAWLPPRIPTPGREPCCHLGFQLHTPSPAAMQAPGFPMGFQGVYALSPPPTVPLGRCKCSW